jgi:hypothetical protein
MMRAYTECGEGSKTPMNFVALFARGRLSLARRTAEAQAIAYTEPLPESDVDIEDESMGDAKHTSR